MDFLLLLVGFVLLIKGADFLVAGAASIASAFGLSSLVIGLTIVSFGTSLPEMLVTLTAGLRANADLAIANIFGSNIANVLLVLGVAAIIRPLPVHDSTVVSEIPFTLTAALLVGFLANAALFSAYPELSISRIDGGILLFFFFLFLLYVYKISGENAHDMVENEPEFAIGVAVLGILAGTAGLYWGGRWVVDGAVGIAATLGVNDALVGLTIVAIGTSAPELVASAVAAYRRQTDIAVGNVVGSNIFNILWVLGLTASLVELPFDVINNTDIVLMIMASAMIIFAFVTSRSNTILRSHGILFVVLYIGYLVYVIYR